MRTKLVASSSGSVLPMALGLVLVLSVVALAATQLGIMLSQDSKLAVTRESTNGLSQTLEFLLADPTICKFGTDGVVGGQSGLEFETAGVPAPFNADLSFAGGVAEQDIRIGTNLAGGTLTIRSGTAVPEFNLTVNRIYIRNAVLVPTSPPLTYSAEVVASLTASNGASLKNRIISNLNFQVDSSTHNLVGCMSTQSPQALCAQMGCVFDAALPGQKCFCKLPPASCPTGEYISGLDTASAPVCKPILITCNPSTPTPGMGPGYFMAGIDDTGKPICLAAVNSPSAVNCAGTWSACDTTLGTKTFTVTQLPQYGGSACPSPLTQTCPVDCAGSWGACGGGPPPFRTYTWTTLPLNGGSTALCTYPNGQTDTSACSTCTTPGFYNYQAAGLCWVFTANAGGNACQGDYSPECPLKVGSCTTSSFSGACSNTGNNCTMTMASDGTNVHLTITSNFGYSCVKIIAPPYNGAWGCVNVTSAGYSSLNIWPVGPGGTGGCAW